ncbi:MAG: hypothetical protein JWO15_1876 [Sphingomonadales bacterium]|jgi:hypothetical protein|nr:hypothetical protein [Sphingomonadales bacterium]
MIGRILITCGGLMLAQSAIAQTATHANAHNPAIKDHNAAMVAAPAAGSNSFTEDQARGRITKAGFGSISALAKDKDGVWRGKAIHGGKTVDVALDYKGNVTTR